MAEQAQSLEIYSQLYIGDYFADTLEFSSAEHSAFRLLLLHIWLHGPPGRWRMRSIAQVDRSQWSSMKRLIQPLLAVAATNIERWKDAIRAFDGQRLPAAEWHIVRTITLERDAYRQDFKEAMHHLLYRTYGTGTAGVAHVDECDAVVNNNCQQSYGKEQSIASVSSARSVGIAIDSNCNKCKNDSRVPNCLRCVPRGDTNNRKARNNPSRQYQVH